MNEIVNELFTNANDTGAVSDSTLEEINIADLGDEIQAGLGVDVDDVTATEGVVLVTIMPDDSGSICFAGKSQDVRDGHNVVIEALRESKQTDGILAHTRYLNGHVLYPYTLLDSVVEMNSSNYDPKLGTPLYDQTVVLLSTVLAKTQEFTDNGVSCRSITLIISDGEDQHSVKQDAASVRKLVTDMLRTEDHIIAFMGINDGGYVDFRQIAEEMGILPEWTLIPGNSKSEIRKAFQVFSQSAVRASQGAASFSQVAIGGFGD